MCILSTMYVCSMPGCPITQRQTMGPPACLPAATWIFFVSLVMLACGGGRGHDRLCAVHSDAQLTQPAGEAERRDGPRGLTAWSGTLEEVLTLGEANTAGLRGRWFTAQLFDR